MRPDPMATGHHEQVVSFGQIVVASIPIIVATVGYYLNRSKKK